MFTLHCYVLLYLHYIVAWHVYHTLLHVVFTLRYYILCYMLCLAYVVLQHLLYSDICVTVMSHNIQLLKT